ncbi:hypothetical protein [Streptomyces sp. NBC_00258]|uniref:hypothetical protein n=1 Tax=Streptomyces sp. NBC_00258 TaxID=2903642 RepID=UPI002E2E4426|nr:hypothetical protein [Streptomyces sp. NBC_00258]
MMDAQSYNTGLAELRTLRDQIKKTTAALARLETERSKAITALADYDKAKADRIAPAAGISVAETVAIAPQLAPDSLADSPAAAPTDPLPGQALTPRHTTLRRRRSRRPPLRRAPGRIPPPPSASPAPCLLCPKTPKRAAGSPTPPA